MKSFVFFFILAVFISYVIYTLLNKTNYNSDVKTICNLEVITQNCSENNRKEINTFVTGSFPCYYNDSLYNFRDVVNVDYEDCNYENTDENQSLPICSLKTVEGTCNKTCGGGTKTDKVILQNVPCIYQGVIQEEELFSQEDNQCNVIDCCRYITPSKIHSSDNNRNVLITFVDRSNITHKNSDYRHNGVDSVTEIFHNWPEDHQDIRKTSNNNNSNNDDMIYCAFSSFNNNMSTSCSNIKPSLSSNEMVDTLWIQSGYQSKRVMSGTAFTHNVKESIKIYFRKPLEINQYNVVTTWQSYYILEYTGTQFYKIWRLLNKPDNIELSIETNNNNQVIWKLLNGDCVFSKHENKLVPSN